MRFEPVEAPNFDEYFTSLENIIGKYEDLIVKKIKSTGSGLLQNIISDLDPIDAIRCFFAALYLARDEKVHLEQENDDIKIILLNEN